MQSLVEPPYLVIKPRKVGLLDPLVTLSHVAVSSGSVQDTLAIQVARHSVRQDIFYGVSPTGGLAPHYVYHRLDDTGGAPIKELRPQHLDLIIAGIILEGFGRRIEPRVAGYLNAGLHDQLNAKLRPYFR